MNVGKLKRYVATFYDREGLPICSATVDTIFGFKSALNNAWKAYRAAGMQKIDAHELRIKRVEK